jgi:hypothetical protein
MVAYLKSLMKGISTHSDKIVANRMENKRSPNTDESWKHVKKQLC